MTDSDNSLLASLANLIPGYKGYRGQEARREDDRLARAYLNKRIGDCKSLLDQQGARAVASGDLELPLKLESLRGRLDHAQSRLAAAVEGYAGWFSSRTVDEALLAKVLKVDENLVSLVDQLEQLLRKLPEATDVAAKDLPEALDLLHARIDHRDQLLRTGA